MDEPTHSGRDLGLIATGAMLAVLGLTQLWQSGLWDNAFGSLVGGTAVGVALLLVAVGTQNGGAGPAYEGLEAMDARSVYRSVKGWLASDKARRQVQAARPLLGGFGLYVLLLILIHISSPDRMWGNFPRECPANKLQGCSRVTEENPSGDRGMDPLRLQASKGAVINTIVAALHSAPRTTLLERNNATGFLHARVVSVFWGFADDFLVRVSCDASGESVVEVQGQLRLGRSDLGVNAVRNQRFLAWLHWQANSGGLPLGSCMD